MIEALIAAGATLLVCLVNNIFNQQRFEAQLKQSRDEAAKRHEETISLISYRLDQLERKQDKYNNIIQRTYELEKAEELLVEKIKTANHRIDDLEQFHKG